MRHLETPAFGTAVRVAASACFALVILLVLALAPRIAYACKVAAVVERPLPAAVLAIVIAAAAACALGFVDRAPRAGVLGRERVFALIVLAWSVGLLAAQAVMVRGTWFEGGWDVGLLARLYPQPASSFTDYLAHYPNNLLLYDLFRLMDRAAAAVGLTDPYLLYIAGSCLSVTIACALCALAAHRALGPAAGFGTLALSTALIGLSPWVLVPYSDTYAMPWPAAALAAYALVRRSVPRWGLVGLATTVGMAVKPTAVFMAAGLVLACAARALGEPCASRRAVRHGAHMRPRHGNTRGTSAAPRRAALALVPLAAGALVGWTLVCAVEATGPRLDPDAAAPSTHFFAMGANPDTYGYFSADDERLSLSIADPVERAETMRNVWLGRLREMGPLGIAKLAARKLMTIYADGTLAWNQEGGFFYVLHGNSDALKGYFGIGNPAPPETAFRLGAQALWLAVLAGIALIALAHRGDAGPVPVVETAALVALALLTGFLLLSEVRARYLILYAPVFAMMAAWGLTGTGRAALSFLHARDR